MLLHFSPKSALATVARSANHRTVWVGRDLKDHVVGALLGILHYSRMLTALSNLPLNASRDGVSTASLGNLLLHSNKF